MRTMGQMWGTEIDIYRLCCGDTENAVTIREIELEVKYPDTNTPEFVDFESPEPPVHTALLSQKSNGAIDSFLKHQFSELTPEIINALRLDPINEIWEKEVRGLIFRAALKLGPLSNLSQLKFDSVDLEEINIKYNETLHLNTNLSLAIKVRESEALLLGLSAEIGINPGGTQFDVSHSVQGEVRVIGLRIECVINFVHSLDIEWDDVNKAIEGILHNNLVLKTINLSYDRIVANFMKQNIEIAPSLWTQIEEEVTGVITDIFEKQISKLLNKVIRKEMDKVLKQINDESPRFAIGFDAMNGASNQHEDDEMSELVGLHGTGNTGNKLLRQLRRIGHRKR